MQANGRLVLFAEGRLSRTGTLMKMFEGTGFLLHKTSAKVITCHLRWQRSTTAITFSPNPGLKKWFPTITAHFSEVLTPPKLEVTSAVKARMQLTSWVRDQMVNQQFNVEMEFGPADVLSAVVATARERPKQIILEDTSHQALTYRRLLVAADVLGKPLQTALPDGEKRVGVLLPNINALPVVLLSLWHIGKIPAILNFSTGAATMLACSQLAGLKQIITSRAFLERARLDIGVLINAGIELVYLEDLRAVATMAKRPWGQTPSPTLNC